MKNVDSKQIQEIMKEEMVLNEKETEIKIPSNVIKTSQKIKIEESSDSQNFKIKDITTSLLIARQYLI